MDTHLIVNASSAFCNVVARLKQLLFLKVMNHVLRHHNIKCLDTIPLYKNHICLKQFLLKSSLFPCNCGVGRGSEFSVRGGSGVLY